MAREKIPMPAELSSEQKKLAITKLQRRTSELTDFDPDSIEDRRDPKIAALESTLKKTVAEIYPPGTTDFVRIRSVTHLDTAGIRMGHPTPIHEVREGLHRGKDRAITLISQEINALREDLDDAGDSDSGRVLRAIEGLDLHPEIERAAGKLFRDQHYANAVEDACKALNMLVKLRSGRDDLDGTNLMTTVFSAKNPVLKVNDLLDQSDADEQSGMMHLFAGAMLGLRNPRAHKLVQDDPERALEYIAFISLLANVLDGCQRA
jgi:uncharacterized protein (TIGR02391 family)